MSRGGKIIGRLGCGGLAILGALFLLGNGMVWMFQVPILLATGWIWFLGRTIPEVQLDPLRVVETLVVLLVLAGGSHHFARWFAGQRDRTWALRQTLALLAAVVLMFTTSIASAGLAHQLVWLTREPMARSSMDTWGAMGIMREVCAGIPPGLSVDFLQATVAAEPDPFQLDTHQVRVVAGSGGAVLVLAPRDPAQRASLGGMLCEGGGERHLDAPVVATCLAGGDCPTR